MLICDYINVYVDVYMDYIIEMARSTEKEQDLLDEEEEDFYMPQISQSIPLTPSQAVRIHGWLQPSKRLHWQTVRDRPQLSFRNLYKLLEQNSRGGGLQHDVGKTTLDLLYLLQPSVAEWIGVGRYVYV